MGARERGAAARLPIPSLPPELWKEVADLAELAETAGMFDLCPAAREGFLSSLVARTGVSLQGARAVATALCRRLVWVDAPHGLENQKAVWLLKRLLEDYGESVYTIAHTAAAAVACDGSHSVACFFGMRPDLAGENRGYERKGFQRPSPLETCDTVVWHYASLFSKKEMWAAHAAAVRRRATPGLFGGLRVVMVGDSRGVPPDGEKAFSWSGISLFSRVHLDEEPDSPLRAALLGARAGDDAVLPLLRASLRALPGEECLVKVVPSRAAADSFNSEALASLGGAVYEMGPLRLRAGARVRLTQSTFCTSCGSLVPEGTLATFEAPVPAPLASNLVGLWPTIETDPNVSGKKCRLILRPAVSRRKAAFPLELAFSLTPREIVGLPMRGAKVEVDAGVAGLAGTLDFLTQCGADVSVEGELCKESFAE